MIEENGKPITQKPINIWPHSEGESLICGVDPPLIINLVKIKKRIGFGFTYGYVWGVKALGLRFDPFRMPIIGAGYRLR
jgi:hypothetical protein